MSNGYWSPGHDYLSQLMTLKIQWLIASRNQPCEARSEQYDAQLSILDEILSSTLLIRTSHAEANDANIVDSDDNEWMAMNIELQWTSLDFAIAQIW